MYIYIQTNIFLDNFHISETCEKSGGQKPASALLPAIWRAASKEAWPIGVPQTGQGHYDDNSKEIVRGLLSTEMDENSTPTSRIIITRDA